MNNDGTADYVVVGVDQGAVQTGTSTAHGLVRLQHPKRRREHRFLRAGADGQRDGEHLRPLAQLCRAGEPCLNAANPRFTYQAVSFDLTETEGPDEVDGLGEVQRLVARHLTGGFQTVAPGGTARRRSLSTRPSGR